MEKENSNILNINLKDLTIGNIDSLWFNNSFDFKLYDDKNELDKKELEVTIYYKDDLYNNSYYYREFKTNVIFSEEENCYPFSWKYEFNLRNILEIQYYIKIKCKENDKEFKTFDSIINIRNDVPDSLEESQFWFDKYESKLVGLIKESEDGLKDIYEKISITNKEIDAINNFKNEETTKYLEKIESKYNEISEMKSDIEEIYERILQKEKNILSSEENTNTKNCNFNFLELKTKISKINPNLTFN